MRARVKIPLYVLAFVALAVAAALILLYKSHFVENLVNRYLADKIASRYNLDITIAEIEGSYLGGFILHDVTLQFTPDDQPIPLGRIPRLAVSYNPSNLWKGNYLIDSLYCERPEFYLRRDDSGRWVLPELVTGKSSRGSLPSWEIKKIIIDSATFEMELPGRKWRWSEVELAASIRSEEGTHTIQLDHLAFSVNDNQLRVAHLSGLATIFEDNIAVSQISLKTDSSWLALSLTAAGGEGGLNLKCDSAHVHLADFTSLMGLDLDGDLDLQGTMYRQSGKIGGDWLISGRFKGRKLDSLKARFHYDAGVVYLDTLFGGILDGTQIYGFGELDLGSRPEVYRLTARVQSFNLDHMVFGSFESNLTGGLALSGRGLGPRSMALDLDLRLEESYFDIYHFHQAIGQMTVTKDGLYFFPGCQVVYHGNRFFFTGSADFGGQLNLEGSADLADLSDFTGQTFIERPSGRAEGEFMLYGPTADPNLSGNFRSDSVWLYELYSADLAAAFDIQSFTRGRRGSISVRAERGQAWSVPYDSLWATMRLDSSWLYIDSGSAASSYLRAAVTGVLDFIAYPQELKLNRTEIDLQGRHFEAVEPLLIRIDSSGFIFDRIDLATSDGRLACSGRANYDETLDLTWKIDNEAIGPWAALVNDTLKVDGRLASRGRVHGNLAYPAFEMEAAIDSLSYQGLYIGRLRSFLTYRDSLLTIDSAHLYSAKGEYDAHGTLPINLTPYFDRPLFDDREQNLYFTARDQRLDLFVSMLTSVEYITGRFDASVVLTGSPRRPHLDGTSRLRDGSIKLVDLRDRLENVQVEVEMADQLITIKGFEAVVPRGKSRDNGTIAAGGTIFVNDITNFAYDVWLKCRNLPVNYEMGDFSGLADADLKVTGATPPRVTGTIVMPQAFYRENFATGEEGFDLMAALEGDKSWNLDLMVECPSNVWVKNDDIDAEFSGKINIIRESGVYNYLGTLEVIRGKLFFLDRTFKIEPGGEIVYNNIEVPNPVLNLDISTRVRSYNRFANFESDESYSYELALHVGGTLENPTIGGTGDTPVSTEDILPTLFTGYQSVESDTSKGESVGADRISSGLGGILAGQFSRLGTRSLGVETFEISPGLAKGFDPLATRLTIGAYTLPNLYVFGSSTFDVQKGQEVGVEYRLGRHYLFEGRRDETELYQFNFKFYWEY